MLPHLALGRWHGFGSSTTRPGRNGRAFGLMPASRRLIFSVTPIRLLPAESRSNALNYGSGWDRAGSHNTSSAVARRPRGQRCGAKHRDSPTREPADHVTMPRTLRHLCYPAFQESEPRTTSPRGYRPPVRPAPLLSGDRCSRCPTTKTPAQNFVSSEILDLDGGLLSSVLSARRRCTGVFRRGFRRS